MRVLILTGALCLVPAMPASAQIWGGPVPAGSGGSFAGRGIKVAPQPRSARSEIRAGERSGELTREEARQLRRVDAANSALAERFSEGGISDSEAAELNTRAILLHEEIVRARFNGTSRPKGK